MTPETAIQLALLAPLVGCVLIALTGRWPNLRETVSLATAVTMFLLVLSILPHVMAGERPSVTLIEMVPGLSITMTVEPLGMTFALIASFLWIITTIYAIGYMRGHHEGNQTRFYAFFAIALFSALGVAMAGNMMTLFVAYEVLSISTYPVGRPPPDRRGQTRRAGLSGHPALHPPSASSCWPSCGRTSPPARSTSPTAASWRAMPRRSSSRCCWCFTSTASARRRSCRSTGGCLRPWSRPPRSARCCMRSRWSRRACSRWSRSRSTSSASKPCSRPPPPPG